MIYEEESSIESPGLSVADRNPTTYGRPRRSVTPVRPPSPNAETSIEPPDLSFADMNPRTYGIRKRYVMSVRLPRSPSPNADSSEDSSGSSDISDFTDTETLKKEYEELLEVSRNRIPKKLTEEDFRSPYPRICNYSPPPEFKPLNSRQEYLDLSPQEQVALCEPLFAHFFGHGEPRQWFIKQFLVDMFVLKRTERMPQ